MGGLWGKFDDVVEDVLIQQKRIRELRSALQRAAHPGNVSSSPRIEVVKLIRALTHGRDEQINWKQARLICDLVLVPLAKREKGE